jgi:hypothetical protein
MSKVSKNCGISGKNLWKNGDQGAEIGSLEGLRRVETIGRIGTIGSLENLGNLGKDYH